MSKTDMQLKQDVEAELGWDPQVNAAQIGISVDQGAVTMRGTVDTYAEKWAAENATKRVSRARAARGASRTPSRRERKQESPRPPALPPPETLPTR
jgi:hypothetical protein